MPLAPQPASRSHENSTVELQRLSKPGRAAGAHRSEDHGEAPDLGRTLVGDRAAVAARTAQAEGWTAGHTAPCCLERHPLCAALRHSVGNAATGDGLWIRRHLLAAAAGLAANWCMGPVALGVAAAPAPGRPHRLEPCLRRQRVHCGEKGGAGTGANPTDRGKAGTKRHFVTDRRSIPLAFLLTGANTHDSKPWSGPYFDRTPGIAPRA